MTNDHSYDPERFSDDPQENLRIENELLCMRLQAQFGGVSAAGENVSPEQENQFLLQALAFEERHAKATVKKVYEIIGRPDFEKAEMLDDAAVSRELTRIEQLLAEKNIELAFLEPRDDRFKYEFITGEFFEHETEDIHVQGLINFFMYEEFHGDH